MKTKIKWWIIFSRYFGLQHKPSTGAKKMRVKKMTFKFHLYFSFFFGLVKWNSIPTSIFRFLSTCDIEKRIWISFFAFRFPRTLRRGFEFRFLFRFLITFKNGFEFRFSYLHCLLLTNRLEFHLSFLHEFEKWINTCTPVIWNSPPPYLRGWPG